MLEIHVFHYRNFQLGGPPLKVVPSADRRGAQMKAPPERAPRGKYAGGVLDSSIEWN